MKALFCLALAEKGFVREAFEFKRKVQLQKKVAAENVPAKNASVRMPSLCAAAALRQVASSLDACNYAEKFDFAGKTVRKIGISFSSEQRTIVDVKLACPPSRQELYILYKNLFKDFTRRGRLLVKLR